MTVRLAIRRYLNGKTLSEDRVDVVAEEQLQDILPELAMKHGHQMVNGEIDMIEIEFMDEPDPLARFFRLGSNPAGMVRPLKIDLNDLDVEKKDL